MDEPMCPTEEALLQCSETEASSDKETMASPIKPSRKAGFALREGLLLMDYELDQNGFMKPGTGKKFPLNASARDIGRSSVGMGVYLTSLQLFVVLNLLLGIFVGIPLMVMNGVESNFTDEFLVRVNGQDQALSADQINASVITAGDYSVYIRNLKYDSIESEHLIDVASHYGDVANAVHIATVGKPIELGLRLETQQLSYDELKAHADNPETYSCLGSIGAFIYWRFIGGFKSGEKAVATMEATMKATQEKLRIAERNDLKSTGCAVVTFNYEAHAKNMLRDYRRSFLAKILGRFTFSFLVLADSPKIRGRQIRVTRAPEPTDIWWENTWVVGADQVKRRIISNLLALSVVALGAVVQFQVDSLSEPDIAPVHKESVSHSMGKRIVPLLTGIVVVVVNLAISILVNSLSYYERWLTRSNREKWLTLKISTFYLVNSFLVPMLVQSTKKRRGTWYLKGGLMEQAFFIQLSNAILPDLLTLFDPLDALNVYFFSRFARTQRMLDNLVMPRHFFLSVRYAAAVKTMGLALFYLPVLPISPLIAALGLLISYFTDKYVALRLAQKPHNLASVVTVAINNVILVLPLVQMLLIWRLYFQNEKWVLPIFWVGAGLWVVFAIMPISHMLKWNVGSKFGDWGTAGAPFQETIGKRARPTQSTISQSLLGVMTPDNPGGVSGRGISLPEVYIPDFPPACSDGFAKKLGYHFALPEQIHPANPELLQGQKLTTGGRDNVAPPKRTSNLEFLPSGGPEQLATSSLAAIPELSEQGDFGDSPTMERIPGAPVFKRLSSLPGVPYDVQAQIMQRSEISHTPTDSGGAYPEINLYDQEHQTNTVAYYPIVYHTPTQ